MKKVIFILLLSLFVLPFGAEAGKDEALSILQTKGDALFAIFNNPDYDNPAKKAEMKAKAEEIVMDTFDFEEFSTRTVGKRWRTFSEDEKTRFVLAFTHLLRNTYIGALDEYDGESIEYTSALEGNNGTRVEVRGNVTSKGKLYPVAFRMLQKNGKWVVYDVLFENISLIKNYREQFSSILATDAPDELIAKIEQKAKEVLDKPVTEK